MATWLLLSVKRGRDRIGGTHLPTINDLFNDAIRADGLTARTKVSYYQPGWYASFRNVLDPGMFDGHSQPRHSVEQVATFPAFDDPTRNVLVLFKLHPWPNGARFTIRRTRICAFGFPRIGSMFRWSKGRLSSWPLPEMPIGSTIAADCPGKTSHCHLYSRCATLCDAGG